LSGGEIVSVHGIQIISDYLSSVAQWVLYGTTALTIASGINYIVEYTVVLKRRV